MVVTYLNNYLNNAADQTYSKHSQTKQILSGNCCIEHTKKKKKKRIEHTPRTNTLFDGSDLTSGKIHHKVPETSEHIHKHHMDTNLWINLAYKHLMQKSIIQ